jgi:hypothetical protein
MLKTLLKSVLIILVLAGVFFFALQYFEERRQQALPPAGTEPTPAAEAAAAITRVELQPFGEGATLQVAEMPGTEYRVSAAPNGKGFEIEIPAATANVLRTTLPNPHPLVTVVEISQTTVGAAPGVRIRVDFAKDAIYRDRLVGKTLLVDVMPKAEAQPTAEPEPTPTPVKKAIMTPPKPKPTPVPVQKVTKAPPKPTPKPVKKAAPAKPAPEPTDALFGEAPEPSAPLEEPPMEPPAEAAAPAPPPPPPTPVPPAPAKPAAKGGDDLDLDALFAESQKEIPGAAALAPAPAAEPPMEEPPAAAPPEKVAALPPAETGRFDETKVTRELSKIRSVRVGQEGGVTTVSFERDKPGRFKFFKKHTPYRLVVEFENAENQLQREYGAIAGTKVQKITSETYRGADMTLTRVTIYMKSLPIYTTEKRGNSLIVKLP